MGKNQLKAYTAMADIVIFQAISFRIGQKQIPYLNKTIIRDQIVMTVPHPQSIPSQGRFTVFGADTVMPDNINPEQGVMNDCSGLMEPDTLIRDNNNQLLRCQNGTETNIQTIF